MARSPRDCEWHDLKPDQVRNSVRQPRAKTPTGQAFVVTMSS
jgi:hypothetical protein